MKLTVKDLTDKAVVLAGNAGIQRRISSPRVVAPDFALPSTLREVASAVTHITPLQSSYLSSLTRPERLRLVQSLIRKKPACIVMTGGRVDPDLLAKAGAANVAVLKSKNLSALSKFLVDHLVPRISMHGVLVEVFGLGTLIIGESAIGKSEAALDLILRQHKLAADDLVVLEKEKNHVIGRATDLGIDLLEIRGLGIINVRALYGESAVVRSCPVGLVVELEEWKRGQHYSLLGLRERRYRILGVNIPYLKLPVKLGRTMATLIEVAARNQILKNRGVFTARELNRRLKKRLTE